jgi:hypothetical protein
VKPLLFTSTNNDGEVFLMDQAGRRPVLIRPLAEEDLDEADRISRVAFGTFVGMAQPEQFFGDAVSFAPAGKPIPTQRWRLRSTGTW